MKRWGIGLIVVAVVLGGLAWLSMLRPAKDDTSVSATQRVAFDVIQQDVQAGAKLYDVRTAEEYATEYFADAINWPLQDIQAGKLPDVAKETKLFVYCRSGNRSAQAAALLKSAGYTNVTDLHGLSDVKALGGTLGTD